MDVIIHVVLLHSGRGPLKWHCWKEGFFRCTRVTAVFRNRFLFDFGISSETHDSNVTVFASWTVWIEFRRKEMTERKEKETKHHENDLCNYYNFLPPRFFSLLRVKYRSPRVQRVENNNLCVRLKKKKKMPPILIRIKSYNNAGHLACSESTCSCDRRKQKITIILIIIIHTNCAQTTDDVRCLKKKHYFIILCVKQHYPRCTFSTFTRLTGGAHTTHAVLSCRGE